MGWEVELYIKENNESPVLDFILSLMPKQQAKIEREIDLLEEFGTSLFYPHAKKIEGEEYKGLWELRVKLGTDTFRFFLLSSCGKQICVIAWDKKED